MQWRTMAAAVAVLIFSSAAQAGVAEDLIAAINKCAAIPDELTRHSCYDRLPGVVKSLTAVPAPVAPPVADARPAQPSTAAQAPVAYPVADAHPAQPSTTVPAVAAAPQPATPAAPPPESKGFLAGFFGASDSDRPPTDVITARVETFTFDYGVFVVTLDNGQVWRQVASLGDVVRLSKERKDQVTIWRNAFGEYVLKVDGYRTQYHVRRIQ